LDQTKQSIQLLTQVQEKLPSYEDIEQNFQEPDFVYSLEADDSAEEVLQIIGKKQCHLPMFELWSNCQSQSETAMAYPMPDNKHPHKRAITAAATHTLLENNGRELDVHAARLCVENLQFLEPGMLKFWMAMKPEADKKNAITILEPLAPKPGVAAKWMQCRLVTLDSHTTVVAKTVLGAGCFFSQTFTAIQQTLVHMSDCTLNMCCAAVLFFLYGWWFLLVGRDASNDVDANPDCHNKGCVNKISAALLSLLDIPQDVRAAPTQFHYKKASLPWAALKVRNVRAWVFAYPIPELANVENAYAGRTVRHVRLAVSAVQLVFHGLVVTQHLQVPMLNQLLQLPPDETDEAELNTYVLVAELLCFVPSVCCFFYNFFQETRVVSHLQAADDVLEIHRKEMQNHEACKPKLTAIQTAVQLRTN